MILILQTRKLRCRMSSCKAVASQLQTPGDSPVPVAPDLSPSVDPVHPSPGSSKSSSPEMWRLETYSDYIDPTGVGRRDP